MTSKINLVLLTVVLSSIVYTGCGSTRSEQNTTQVLTIRGSDTMLFLVRRWAEEFMQQHPGVAVYTEGGGSRKGIQALINSSVDIASVSRPWQPQEIKALVEKQGSLGFSVLCARDALSLYVNPENPVRNLNLTEIREIYTGKISNWREVGGRDEAIVLYKRNPNSGTYLFFEEHVLLGESYSEDAKTLPTTAAIVQAVAEAPDAIGYGGLAYGDAVIHCRVNGIEPTAENVRNGQYPISRYLYLYTVQPPRGLMKKFIDWTLEKQGQQIVEEVGYIPLYNIEKPLSAN